MMEHLRILLRRAEQHRAGTLKFDDVYVWWGKVRSPNRQQKMKHLDSVISLDHQAGGETETHLYLTDYRSLYVGWMGEVTVDDVGSDPDERDAMPPYYGDYKCDCWFKLWDIRRIVDDDTPAVVEELKKLRNVNYNDRPVSLYGGMVDLPLITRRQSDANWFSDREVLLDGALWVERDSENREETRRMEKELRDNLFGPRVWAGLSPATRAFLSAAEAVFRARRDDPGFDFSGPLMHYAKAVEVEVNVRLFEQLRKHYSGRPAGDRLITLDGNSVDLASCGHMTLGTLRLLIEKRSEVREPFEKLGVQMRNYWLGVLPNQIQKIITHRNSAAHAGKIGVREADECRSTILGIGQVGLLHNLSTGGT